MSEMTDYEKLKANLVTRFLDSKEIPDKNELKNLAGQLCTVMGYTVSPEEIDGLVLELASKFDIRIKEATMLSDHTHIPWLHTVKKDTDFYYWKRYRWYLADKQFFPRNVITEIDDVTDNKILDYLENPKKVGSWLKKGLVMGHVQSGKTANYTALINKAADVGYRLIILIAGVHNNLRRQTQIRINEGFIGRDGVRNFKVIGVGEYDDSRFPGSLTSTEKDFTIDSLRAIGIDPNDYKEPMILVIKKNKHTLENVIRWLKGTSGSGTLDYPMLLIDDEADNASINTTGTSDESTTINRLIRELLHMFRKRCYVGYTATPFANIFIDPENSNEMLKSDLFPENFIVSLNAPENYLGAERIFLSKEGEHILRDIDDYADLLPLKHKKNHKIEELPESLYRAVHTFILVIAIRKLRGQGNRHNSMLVNVSRFKDVQHRIKLFLFDYLSELSERVRYNVHLTVEWALQDSYVKALCDVWQEEFASLEYDWETIQPILAEVVSTLKVFEINSSRNSDALDYDAYREDGLNVIAVGGFSLSRGFTLEGLSVSYFLRNSIMYDTLMQMGRWFGYRFGYEDLCRIYMTPEAQGWYAHIAESMEELRDDIRTMGLQGLTPREFGLKVRSHPDSLIVTAHNKMKTARKIAHEVNYEGTLVETRRLYRDNERISQNIGILKDLVKQLVSVRKPEPVDGRHWLWKDIPADMVLAFVEKFINHPSSMQTDSSPLARYIRTGLEKELQKWDVAIVGKRGRSESKIALVEGIDVMPLERKSIFKEDYIAVSGSKARVGQASDEKLGLEPEALAKAEEAIKNRGGKISGDIFRRQRSRPLLLLYLLDVRDKESDEQISPVAAYGISFPYLDNPEERESRTVLYDVNLIWWQQHYGDDLEGEDE